jgi:hypothetical protein
MSVVEDGGVGGEFQWKRRGGCLIMALLTC